MCVSFPWWIYFKMFRWFVFLFFFVSLFVLNILWCGYSLKNIHTQIYIILTLHLFLHLNMFFFWNAQMKPNRCSSFRSTWIFTVSFNLVNLFLCVFFGFFFFVSGERRTKTTDDRLKFYRICLFYAYNTIILRKFYFKVYYAPSNCTWLFVDRQLISNWLFRFFTLFLPTVLLFRQIIYSFRSWACLECREKSCKRIFSFRVQLAVDFVVAVFGFWFCCFFISLSFFKFSFKDFDLMQTYNCRIKNASVAMRRLFLLVLC